MPWNQNTVLLGMSACLFVLGLVSIGSGIVILVSKSMGGELKEIARQTAKITQRGITDDMAGLVGNASSLIDALNQLVRTSSGIGIFLVLVGFLLVGISYLLVMQTFGGN